MLFSSFSFLFWFLPLVLLLYFGLPPLTIWASRGRFSPRLRPVLQNGVLLAAGLLFYAWGEPTFLFLLPTVVLVDFALGRAIAAGIRPRLWLWLGVGTHVAVLFFFKYAAAVLGPLGLSPTLPHLPLGLSFYTFQGIAYLADVYSGRTRCEKSLFSFATYLLLFPPLIAGPIVRYEAVSDALRARRITAADAACGGRRFLCGLTKKLLIADAAGALFHDFAARTGGTLTLLGALLALFGFFFQIYYDFSGYSDMAIGLGRILGFRFPENFNYPYTAASFTDFWRRWHMSLSAFFRDYVYIPLGGNRRGSLRTVLHLLAVWSLTGLWHGASTNFLLWGLYYFLLLVAEKRVPERVKSAIPSPVCRLIVIFGVLFGWLIFAFDGSASYLTLGAMGDFLRALSGRNGVTVGADLYDFLRHLPFFAVATLGATALPHRLYEKVTAQTPLLTVLFPVAAMLLAVAYLADASFLPFLYAGF